MNGATIRSESEPFAEIAEAVCERLARNQLVRRTLPGGGRIKIDRQLPFVVLYRSPPRPDAGTRQLVTTEASYLFASGDQQHQAGLDLLCQRVSTSMREHFGIFLFIEIWSTSERSGQRTMGQPSADSRHVPRPEVEIVTTDPDSIPSTVQAFREAFSEIRLGDRTPRVTVRHSATVAPPGLPPLSYECANTSSGGCCVLGIAIRPVYRDSDSATVFPIVLQTLRSQLAVAVRKGVSQFTGQLAAKDQMHHLTLGPTALVRAARQVDEQLSEVANAFDFLLQVTPTNSDAAWEDFSANGFRKEPTLYYRPLPWHPALLKRQLFRIPVERIEDSTLAHLLWEKQEDLDRRLTALRDLNTRHFRHGSIQLYGKPDVNLRDLADTILQQAPAQSVAEADNDIVHADTVVQAAHREIEYYRQRMPEFQATVVVSDDIASGLMVSRNRLLISSSVRIRRRRLAALLHHEIGTHLVTYFNGRQQPFQQLHSGLAGYEDLQEGLAILSEFLSGGLTIPRLRKLAGRVVAVHSMLHDDAFLQTFTQLHEGFGFPAREAFSTTLRAYRGGGLTKDIIYLRGLRDLLHYLGQGHEIDPLYVGKFSLQHIPYIQEMRRRGIIRSSGVLPRFREDTELRNRLELCRGRTIPELIGMDQ